MSEQIIDTLSEEEAWELIRSNQIGRIASAREGAPDIYPISFVVNDWNIYFRTGADSRLRQDCEGRLVAFETASQEPQRFTSAVSLGVLASVQDAELVDHLDTLPIIDFAPNKNYIWLEFRPNEIRGRRLNVVTDAG